MKVSILFRLIRSWLQGRISFLRQTRMPDGTRSPGQPQVREVPCLCAVTDLDGCAKVAGELVDNYIDNRLIWQELNWYKEHGSILGKHPAFAEFRRRKKVMQMPVKELMKRLRQVEMNIWRVKSELAKGDKPHLDATRQERLAGYGKERADILRLLE